MEKLLKANDIKGNEVMKDAVKRAFEQPTHNNVEEKEDDHSSMNACVSSPNVMNIALKIDAISTAILTHKNIKTALTALLCFLKIYY